MSKPVTTEMSWTFADSVIHEGSLWPQEAQVDDFLRRIAQG